ncbi:MAG: Asp-tRNA(Asn)/Glu-tRNA(Gln) amidotransferase subunit GatC [Clostridia bacterium]|nr:Asp-tRNA(Asn)/Glu-tRNA(Gln) amidotransferase subunit GatC [Clostridia bacterium]
MSVSEKELLHIADLSSLELKKEEMQDYLENFQEIIDFSNVIKNAPVEDLDITIGINESKNRFRKDEIKEFKDTDALLANGQGIQQNMYKLPKVVQ